MSREKNQNEEPMNEVEKNLLEAVTEFRDTLKSGEKIQNRFTMRRVELQLKPQPLSADAVKALREQFYASQSVFAMLIGISPSTLKTWEQGTQAPPAWASRLLRVMRDHPDPWFEILKESTSIHDSSNNHDNLCQH